MPRGQNKRPGSDQLRAAVEAYRASGLNASAAARSLAMDRGTFRHRLKLAAEDGMIGDEEVTRSPNTPDRDAYLAAKIRKLAAFEKKKAKGDWRKPTLIHLPARPFRLKIFGDPHMDSDAFDLALFERHWLDMDAENGVYGICVGDWFNNWLRVLGHLWKEEKSDPDDAWLVFRHLMGERGNALLAACSGNHDDWSHGPVDPIWEVMREFGVRYRKGAIRAFLQAGDAVPYSVSIRHKWRGASMYSAAHGLRRAAEKGWNDDLLVGGHIHQDELRHYQHPDGRISTLCQVSAFKAFDDYVDTHGLMGPRISPCWDLVVNPFRSPQDPDRTKVFWDNEAAAASLLSERARQSY